MDDSHGNKRHCVGDVAANSTRQSGASRLKTTGRKTMSLAFDIETTDLPHAVQRERCKPFIDSQFVDEPYKEFSPGNAKKAETVAAKRAEYDAAKLLHKSGTEQRRAEYTAASEIRRENWYADKLKKARLNAHLSQVLCYSVWHDTGYSTCQWADGDERAMLVTLIKGIESTLDAGENVVGANLIGFDVPYIYRRALLLGIPCGSLVSIGYGGRYEIHPNVIDVLKVYQGPEWGSIPPIGLNVLAACFGVDGKTESSGANFAELAIEDRERAEAYAIADSRIAWEIAGKMGLVETKTEEPW